jgi:predicted TIM-barrel fold metal-dependent hydrolase
MKVYDTHAHIFIKDGIPEAYLNGMAKTMKLVVKNKFKIDMTIDDIFNQMIEPWYDPDASKLLATMDQAGIEKTVIFGADFGAAIGDPKIHIFEANKLYADLAKKHPDRLIALCSLDPRRPGAIKHAEQCIEEWGMRGFKLHPAAGFYPTDGILWPFYEKCADWNVPLVFHTGGQPAAPVSLDTQRSLFLAEAATRFPDTKFIMAHVAMDLWAEAVMYGKLIPNLYFDLSYHQFSYVTWGAQKFYEWVRFLIDECGAGKLLWATDTPLPTALLPTDQYVKVFTERQTDVPFTEEEIELMMWKNAAEIFRI